jgi:DNA-binding NtrC family response regulator
VPEELRAYIANWQVLLARPDATDRNGLEAYLRQAGLRVIKTENVVSTLQQIESNRALNAMIIDMTMLGDQAQPLLRAVVKLQPGAALVVLCESLQEQPEHLAAHAVFAPTSAAPDTILQAVLKARELAGRRRPA